MALQWLSLWDAAGLRDRVAHPSSRSPALTIGLLHFTPAVLTLLSLPVSSLSFCFPQKFVKICEHRGRNWHEPGGARSGDGQRDGQKAPGAESWEQTSGWGRGGGWARLTVIHQGQRDLVFGFSILKLGSVRPFVILRQVLDDHFHQALLSDKIDFAVLRRINPENLFSPFSYPRGYVLWGTNQDVLGLGG